MTKKEFMQETLDVRDVPNRYHQKSFKVCHQLADKGYRFVYGNNPKLGYTNKWKCYNPIRIVLTNSKHHTLWAIRWGV